jgi:iron complex transport system ATP-binding protein
VTTPPILAGYSITHLYGGALALSEVSLEASRGEIVALLGPNGSGKSTLLKILAGILPQNPVKEAGPGQVRFMGQDFLSFAPDHRARSVAYVPAELRAEFPLSAQETVLLGRICHGAGLMRKVSDADRQAVQQAMEHCNCWGLRARELHTLSGGERQIVALARALAQGARALLLDEALGKMDLNHQAMMGKLLKRLAGEGYAIILVSHDVNLASEWADRCFLLRSGRKLAEGPTREVLTAANMSALFPGAEFEIGSNPSTGAPKIFPKL